VARASVSTLAAATLVLVALATVAVAAIRISREGGTQLAEYLQDLYRVYSASIEARVSDSGVVITSSTPLRLMAAYLVDGGVLTEVCGEVYVANSATIGDGTLVSRLRAGGKLLLIFEGGRYLVVGSDPATEGQGGELLKEAYSTSRLLPLLAQYLDPVSYDSVTSSYIPVALAVFNLTPSYRPYVRWSTGSSTRYCYDYLLYVEVEWDRSNWYVTYRKCAADGPILESLTVPRSQTSVPYREWLYNSTCSVSNGIRYCFDVYAYASGRCDSRCGDPPNSWWFFEVGMRVVYRFEPVEPGYKVLVVLNRTTYENSFGRGVATCTLYTSNAFPGCVKCSPTADTGMCNYPPASSVVNYLLRGCRPVFWWDIRYDESWEYFNFDDGFAEGAWFPQTSTNTVFNVSAGYAYAVGGSVVIAFQKSGGRVQYAGMYDYIRRLGTYQAGYYPVRFKLVYDEGGIASDARAWDYRVVVFLLRKY
jgi:hypothetical protein